ncbi:MAG TPA: HAD-IC family P-type ATPase, partial [Verrucomicrobiae bacterium]|nr:HAD-IC family P-type ATPase [Verrucomicrobiae bacterium]
STLEVVAAARLALFDKTGTLTLGKPAVIGVDAYGGATAADVLHLAAAVERRSTHPLARAIVAAAASPAEESAALDVRTVRGGGATGVLDGARIDVGSASFLASNGIALQDGGAQETRVYVARDGRAVGAIVLADEPRPTAAAAIARLRALGVASAIVSGDAAAPTRRLAELLGVERFDAGVSPEGKAELVEAWRRAQRGPVLFVGDGINDAPALAAADAGFAMGDASAVALETAGAAILSNDPLAVCEAVAVARATVATIRVNLFWAFAYNVALVPLAALGIVQPMLAAAAMGASSLFVVGNSLLLSRRGAAQPVHDRDA